MRDAPMPLVVAKNRLSNPAPFLWLIDVRVPSDPETMIRITPNPKAVRFGTNEAGVPIEYKPFPVSLGVIEEDSEGGTPEFTITVGGATREMMALLLAYDFLTGQPVKLTLVHQDHLDDPTSGSSLQFEITNCSGDERQVTFVLSTENLYNWKVPNERIHRDFCGYIYKGRRCGFAHDPTNTLGECDHTFETGCVVRGEFEAANGLPVDHPHRFGGAPALIE